MGQPGLNRRQLLGAAGGLAVAAGFGFAALGSGADALASGARTRVRYWNLFSGGDGGNMVAMVDAFHRAYPDVAVRASTPDAPYAVEGASILHYGAYYYLFASYDACCAGVNSTYKIRVGRSTSITGPYADSTGTPMAQAAATCSCPATAATSAQAASRGSAPTARPGWPTTTTTRPTTAPRSWG
ncbi:family 43 glycosylhydrolase [Streptomyces sp. NPDC101165]|uniref:family 43 glycosylhydrolase n=1 Tax=Streptomyces sp. NPDC101165 TaxID=3366119 RepID=UPI00380D0CFD